MYVCVCIYIYNVFVRIVNGSNLLNVLVKESISDVWHGVEFTSAISFMVTLSTIVSFCVFY